MQKKNISFCRTNDSASIDINIDSVALTVRPLSNYRGSPFFLFSVNNSFSMKKMEKSSRHLPHFIFDFTYVCKVSSRFYEAEGRECKKMTLFHLKILFSK